jgi:endogenous inhibitor of DNA gyrase (YacG/DUF329 family)
MACPICERKADAAYAPFCSKRCADVDLARWFTGGYALPSADPDDTEALAEALEEAARNADEDTPGKPH